MLTSESMVSYGMITMAKTYGDSQALGWGGIGKATRQTMRSGTHMALDFQAHYCRSAVPMFESAAAAKLANSIWKE